MRFSSAKANFAFITSIGAALITALLLSATLVQAKSPEKNVYRQPAYISNAYFSDKIAKEGELIQPLTIMKALQTRSSGEIGYFILDLILTHPGRHEFKVNILDKSGKKVMDLTYPQVEASKDNIYPLYTAVGSISGKVHPGLWFFKVYDRVNKGMWHRLGIFAITILASEKEN
jgi:hypothetical protein